MSAGNVSALCRLLVDGPPLMETPYGLLKYIAKAALNFVGGGIAGDVLVEVLPDIGKDVWAWWSKDRDEAGRKADVEALAQTPTATLRKQAEQVVAEVALDRPAAERDRLAVYLSLLPSAIRQSLRRPSDPTGTSVPSAMSLSKPDDLIALLPTRVPRFKPGDRPQGIGDWELVEMLGAGGFGEVWKAKHVHFDGIPPVALKFCLDPNARDRLLKHEATVLNQVMRQGKHPGIVPLLDAHLGADPPCLKYEFVSGGDLVRAVYAAWQKGPMTPDTAGKIVLKLARTMGFAHRLSPPIVHRDLKPANVLVRPRPDGHSADLLIADFGIGGVAAVQALEAEKQASRPPSVSFLRGSHTPLYASPQQKKGAAPDPRDDVHALGVIWYQLLVGDLTKGVPTGLGWTKKLTAGGVPTDMVDLLAECIEEDPEGRPRDAQGLAERLNALVNLQPTPTPTPTPSPSPTPTQPKAGEVSTNSLGMRFAFVPRGSFWMGGMAGTPGDEEVTIKHDFRLGVFSVTQGQWQAVMGNNPSYFSRTGDGKDEVKDVSDADLKDFPVEQVSWDDVQEFLGKLNEREKKSGVVYRLPTEVEWEYACREAALSSGGSMSKEDCSFDFYLQPQPTNSLSSRQANFNGKYPCGGAGKGPYLGRTCKVGSYQPNRLGIYDLHGNVWEWCQDTDDGGETRVFRGGGCYDAARHCRASTRDGGEPDWSGGHVGFRLVQVLPESDAGGKKLALRDAGRQAVAPPREDTHGQGRPPVEAKDEDLDQLARVYEQIRSSMPAGNERTVRMEAVAVSMAALAKKTVYLPVEVGQRFQKGTEGDRLAAIQLVQGNPNPASFQVIAEAIRNPRSAFEQYRALLVAQAMLPQIDNQQKQELGEVLQYQRSGAEGAIINPQDPGRFKLSGIILAALGHG